MERRTRLGKVVGSIKTSPDGFTYWAEKNSTTGEDGYITVAPSGARMSWFKNERDAILYVMQENEDWFS